MRIQLEKVRPCADLLLTVVSLIAIPVRDGGRTTISPSKTRTKPIRISA